jgi:hypothetical protein
MKGRLRPEHMAHECRMVEEKQIAEETGLGLRRKHLRKAFAALVGFDLSNLRI